jgi:hypothetical protein
MSARWRNGPAQPAEKGFDLQLLKPIGIDDLRRVLT